jgi:hypothetical protein
LVAAFIVALLPFLAGGEFVQASSTPAGFNALAQGASVIALGTVLGSASQ